MNRKCRNKVVTSGRLTGTGRVPRKTSCLPPAARPATAFSLYSTDSEEQIATLHKGLDQCAALLNGILQAEKAVSPDLSVKMKPAAPKLKPASVLPGKKNPKKPTAKPVGVSRTIKSGAAKARPISTERRKNLPKTPELTSPPPDSAKSTVKSQRAPNTSDSPLRSDVILPLLLSSLKEKRRASENAPEEPVRDTDRPDAAAMQKAPCDPPSVSAAVLQEEFLTAQNRFQELQKDLAELREALRDAQSQLRNAEEENGIAKKELELARNKLLASEREKNELASLSRQQEEEIERLKKLVQMAAPVRGDVERDFALEPGRLEDPSTTERIKRYLMSLSREEPQQNFAKAWRGRSSSASHSEADSVWSCVSAKSGTTFNTRDEAAFRDGLEALDASIASLQKTIQLDLKR